jgi:hypothetical protein
VSVKNSVFVVPPGAALWAVVEKFVTHPKGYTALNMGILQRLPVQAMVPRLRIVLFPGAASWAVMRELVVPLKEYTAL